MTAPPPVRIRRPDHADAGTLAAMVDELNRHEGDETGRFTAETARADVIAPGAPVSCALAERGGQPIGFALWHFGYETAWAARGAYLTDLYVREPSRGVGVGDALLRHVARETKSSGGTFIWWTAYRTNEAARAFYRRRADEEDGVVAYAAAHERFAALLRD